MSSLQSGHSAFSSLSNRSGASSCPSRWSLFNPVDYSFADWLEPIDQTDEASNFFEKSSTSVSPSGEFWTQSKEVLDKISNLVEEFELDQSEIWALKGEELTNWTCSSFDKAFKGKALLAPKPVLQLFYLMFLVGLLPISWKTQT